MNPEKPTLDALVKEAKEERVRDVDWSKVEAKLFPRVEAEARAQAALGAYAGAKRVWVAAAVVLAAAAAVPLFFPRGDVAPLDGVSAVRAPSAGTLLEKERATVVVHAATAAGASRDLGKGDAIAQGDILEAHAGRAVFTRTDPSGVTWSLEDGSQVDVRAARGTLILALAKGAVEAQVTPVPNGEAFAIDVEGTRVAVHGTHLRVERQGTRAIVDLREGVVSIGTPPKSGATYGDLVTAPAHVEFDSADPHGTLKVSHEATRVRAAQQLGPVAMATEPPSAVHLPPIQLPTPVASATPPRPVPPPAPPAVAAPVAPPAAPAPPLPAAVTSPVPPPPAPPLVDSNPQGTIADQVRACARKHVEHADGVVITVSTRLDLRVGDSGMVTTAIFDPPLAPEVQACAAHAIYGTRFAQPGAVTIQIDVTP